MRPKVYIPQPIPEVAVHRLKNVAEVEVFPYIDRVISREELSIINANVLMRY